MAAKNGNRDQVRDCSRLVSAFLDRVQNLLTCVAVLFVLLVPKGNLRVQIPTVIIESRLPGEFFDFGMRLFLQMQESYDHVRDLHAGIVDVILDIHFPAHKTQQANKCVAKDGIAEVPDVRGLVGINAGVLNQNLARWNVGSRFFIGGERGGKLPAHDSGIDVASSGNFQLLKPIDWPHAANNLFGNLPRRLPQLLGQLEG